jgi:ubiquinone/menaquinone biosynthesis C-methylase UbiE
LRRFYGCGAPVPLGIEGLRVLDLGSGSGRDCYLAAAFVGPKGHVVGIDMTPEQLAVGTPLSS